MASNENELQEKYISQCKSVKKYFEIKEEIEKLEKILKVEITREGVYLYVKVMDEIIKWHVEPPVNGKGSVSISSGLFSFGEIEPEVSYILFKLALRSKVFFDIGANTGYYTVTLKKLNPKMKCYSFEPNLVTCELLNINLQINGISNENVYNEALSNENGQGNLYFDKRHLGAASMKDLKIFGEDSPNIQKCKLERMDDFVLRNDIQNVDVIKCDVEGAELLVFEGARESLKRFRPVVVSEMLRKWSAKFEYHPNDIISLFKELNYECYALSVDGIFKIKTVTESTIETNYLFIPMEKVKHVLEYLRA